MTSTTLKLEILYFKLNNGEDLMAQLLEETEEDLTITQVIQMRRMISPLGNGISIGMMPWVPMTELMPLKYTLQKSTVAAMVEIPEESNIVMEYHKLIQKYSEDETLESNTSSDQIFDMDDEQELPEEDNDEMETLAVPTNKNRMLH